jgi:WD40 repeat protein
MTWEPNRDPSQVFLMTPLVGEVEYEGITVQTEFPGPIHGLVPSPNWHLLGVVLEKHIGIWGWEEGVRLATLESLFRLIPTMAWGPKEQTIVSGCKNGAVIEWDVARQLIRRTLDFEIGSINAVAVAPDGLTAAAAGDRDIVIWDLE